MLLPAAFNIHTEVLRIKENLPILTSKLILHSINRMEIKQIAHVNEENQPLCNQEGDYLHLCETDEFEMLPKECRCQRCEHLYRHCFNAPNSKQYLLTQISRKTSGQDSWCPVTDLCKRQTEAERTSLSRSLRQLELEGLVEITTNGNEAFVRLRDKGNSTSAFLLDVFQINEDFI